jgi:hypothetical protein
LQSVILASEPGEDMPGQEDSTDPGKAFTTLEAEGLDPLAPKEAAPSVLNVGSLRPSADLRKGLERLAPEPGTGGLFVAGGGTGGVALARTRELSAPFQGRTGAARSRPARRGGATTESERSVGRGLVWLARHQRPDGSWSLDHRGQCQGKGCPAGKHADSDTAATGLALLPLLGAGHTHTEAGLYQKTVDDALTWLRTHQKPDGDLFTGGGGNTHMYSHAIATMALCEAYGLTRDDALRDPARRAVGFIVQAQNHSDGGWRYNPGSAGDTSVFGWQMFALRSAYLAGIEVPAETVRRCRVYLDLAACDHPQMATYAYQPGQRASLVMTAEALLGRQYLGWTRESPALLQGADLVARDLIKSKDRNIYYWYYATQLLHNMQGDAWERWYVLVRDGLVRLQVEGRGCDRGSWDPVKPRADRWGKDAGRHFVTSLSLLTLEVYYRYLPLYQERDQAPLGSHPDGALEARASGPVG